MFEPYYATTDDVGQTIKRFAHDHKIELGEIDFEIVATQTFVKQNDAEDYAEISLGDLHDFCTPTRLLDPAVKFRQVHEIRLIPMKKNKGWKIGGQVAADRLLSKVRFIIKKESKFPEGLNTEELLVADFNRRKARLGLLVGVFDEMMRAQLRRLTINLVMNPQLDEDFELELCKALEPIPTRNDDLKYHFKEKKPSENSDTHIKDRGHIYSVVKDEVVIEYVKPMKGKPGRNCKGEYIPAGEPTATKKPTFKTSPNIAIEETPRSINFKAARSGYVIFTDTLLDIGDTLEMNEISFKQTGSMALNLASDVTIDIKKGDITEDSIGQGVFVEVADLRIAGSVGPDTTIKAKTVTIGGQTHQKSTVTCQVASIVSHRGVLECRQATIERIEGGTINASEKVQVQDMMGGKIQGRVIAIEQLHSNCFLQASEMVEIKNLVGTNNRIVIKMGDSDEVQLTSIRSQMASVQLLITSYKKDLIRLNDQFEPYKARFKQLREIYDTQGHGNMLPSAINEYQILGTKIRDMKKIRDKIQEQTEKVDRLKGSLKGGSSNIERAKVIMRGSWKGYNEVIFELSDPKQTLTYIPKAGERAGEIRLRKKNHDEDEALYEIEVIR